MRQNGIIIAIDGPTASGKSTTAKHVAERLGYLHINTGAMYRAFALYVMQWSAADLHEIEKLADRVYIDFDENGTILLEGRDVSDAITAPEVARRASELSSLPFVRDKMVAMQREIGKNGGVVLDGRDIGTVVFPDAELKIFLTASNDVRIDRRLAELQQKGIRISRSELEQEIQDRDKRDSEREHSPLRKAADAVEIDTSLMSIDEQVDIIVKFAAESITTNAS